MRKYIIIIAAALASVSCSKLVMDPLRLDINGTYWTYSTDTQTARMAFPDNEHVSVLQWDLGTNSCQAEHGTYELDGHRVLLSGNNWSRDVKLVRTFTHLKNSSTNKNMTPLKPVPHESLAGSVWTTMENDNLHLAFFDYDGTCLDATFINANRKEGKPYGWQWTRNDYSLSGSDLQVGAGVKATLYDDMMQVDTLTVLRTAPALNAPGSSALAGTVWRYQSSDYPGIIIFTSGSTFTRVIVGSRILYQFMNGTYQLNGTELFMTDGEIKETCQLSTDRFTFFEKTFVKVSLP